MSKRSKRCAPDGPFIQLTLELLQSPAWSGDRGINCIRFIDFLMVEHMKHGGNENGNLGATYTQLIEAGIGRRLIAPAIREAEDRGLVRVQRGAKKGRKVTEMSRYRLTFLKTRERTGDKWMVDVPPTDDWKRYTGPHKIGSPSCTLPVHLRAVA